MRVPLCTALAALTVLPGWADSYLRDSYDEFTDERILAVGVTTEKAGLLSGPDVLVFSCVGGDVHAVLKPGGFNFHLGDTIEAKMRFDDKPYVEDVLRYGDSQAMKLYAQSMLGQAIGSDRLIAKLGKADTMRFDLASARSRLAEFDRRCAAWSDGSRMLNDSPISVLPRQDDAGHTLSAGKADDRRR